MKNKFIYVGTDSHAVYLNEEYLHLLLNNGRGTKFINLNQEATEKIEINDQMNVVAFSIEKSEIGSSPDGKVALLEGFRISTYLISHKCFIYLMGNTEESICITCR
jgi:hypothetical protein